MRRRPPPPSNATLRRDIAVRDLCRRLSIIVLADPETKPERI